MENNEDQKTEAASEKQKKESLKIEGVSHQLNMGVGSPLHARFALLYGQTGFTSPRQFVSLLLDLYERRCQLGDAEQLNRRMAQLEAEKEAAAAESRQLEQQLAELQEKYETACREASTQAESSLGKHLQLEEMKQQMEGAVVLKPNPVVAFFLNEMAEKEGTQPSKILEKLFIDDLQNPRSNNLPYTVTGSRIREVMNELKNNA